MSKLTSLQRRVPEANIMTTMSASAERRPSSERPRCQGDRGMTITCCPGSSKSFWARMHHKVVGNFGSEADVRSLYNSRFRFNETSDVGACTHGRPAKKILTELRPRYFESEPDFRPMHTKLERLLSKSLTTLEVMTYYLVVHTGPGEASYRT